MFRKARIRAGYPSIRAAARRIRQGGVNISHNTIARLERGEGIRPSPNTIGVLAQCYKIESDQILAEAGISLNLTMAELPNLKEYCRFYLFQFLRTEQIRELQNASARDRFVTMLIFALHQQITLRDVAIVLDVPTRELEIIRTKMDAEIPPSVLACMADFTGISLAWYLNGRMDGLEEEPTDSSWESTCEFICQWAAKNHLTPREVVGVVKKTT